MDSVDSENNFSHRLPYSSFLSLVEQRARGVTWGQGILDFAKVSVLNGIWYYGISSILGKKVLLLS